jgi:hypothetical protein
MNYKIEEIFDHGQKRYWVFGYDDGATTSRNHASECGAFIYKRSAVKCLKMKELNQKIMCLVSKHPGMTEEIEEIIFEALEETIDAEGE